MTYAQMLNARSVRNNDAGNEMPFGSSSDGLEERLTMMMMTIV